MSGALHVTDVVFDFFGTLVQYDAEKCVGPLEVRAHAYLVSQGLRLGFEAFREELGAEFERQEAEAGRTGREPHLFEIARAFLERIGLGAAPPPVVEEFTLRYVEEWGSSTRALPGLAPFLSALGRRYRLSVLSNTFFPPLVHGNLERLAIRRHFAHVLTSAELGVRKPDRRAFDLTLARLGVERERCVYVGDSLKADYLGARGAGWTAYLIDPSGRHADVQEHRLRHLFDLSDALMAAPALP